MNEIERSMFMKEMKLGVFDSVKLVDHRSESQTTKLDSKQKVITVINSFIMLTVNHDFLKIIKSNQIFNIII